jgi:hypothetical protein
MVEKFDDKGAKNGNFNNQMKLCKRSNVQKEGASVFFWLIFNHFLMIFCCIFCMSTVTAQCVNTTISSVEVKLQNIHSKLQLLHGNFQEEYPEQLMTAMYLSDDAKVLELGGNVGRNSCVIASILKNSKNLVTLESCPDSAVLLRKNRDINELKFNIEVSALSKRPLIQSGWTTIPSAVDLPGYFRLNIISFDDLQEKYDIKFDTLIADCEGALYYILQDDPEILKNMNMIIIENDFIDMQHMLDVQKLFCKYGLKLVYNQSGGWGPCYDHFYQVWKK